MVMDDVSSSVTRSIWFLMDRSIWLEPYSTTKPAMSACVGSAVRQRRSTGETIGACLVHALGGHTDLVDDGAELDVFAAGDLLQLLGNQELLLLLQLDGGADDGHLTCERDWVSACACMDSDAAWVH